MVGHGPEKHYVDPGSDLEITWAQRIFTNLTCFSNCEILANFRQKNLKQKKNQKNGLEYREKILAQWDKLLINGGNDFFRNMHTLLTHVLCQGSN